MKNQDSLEKVDKKSPGFTWKRSIKRDWTGDIFWYKDIGKNSREPFFQKGKREAIEGK